MPRRFSPQHPPRRLCLLRLSALGDITHVLPTLRTLQQHWPDTEITWIIGNNEYQLVQAIPGIRFIVFDKSLGFAAYHRLGRDLRQQLAGERFDVLLHMQLSLRASVASMFIPAQTRLGFDRVRARNLQSLVCNACIDPASTRQHVLDSFLEFPRYFGLDPVMRWQLPVDASATRSIRKKLGTMSASGDNKELLVINPCAVARSKNWRNWTDEGYAAVADFAAQYIGMTVVLCGGPSELEVRTAQQISRLCRNTTPLDLVGKTTIDELVALLDIADVVIAPDTGPVHIASALGTKTLGLYAATNPQRAGPYNFMDYVVNEYPQALLQYHGLEVADAPWGKRIKTAESMSLITPQAVIAQLERLLDA